MQCPICGGPLSVEDPGMFVCRRGHRLEDEELRRTASHRASMALWMAIEALETEAEALRLVAERELSPNGGAGELADRAEADAHLLRQLVAGDRTPTGGGDVVE